MENLTYYTLKQRIEALKNRCPDHGIIGYSFAAEPIYYFHIGSYCDTQILIEAGIHAREYIGTLATIEEIKNLLATPDLPFGVYFIPQLNPDGARLVLDGLKSVSSPALQDFLVKINRSTNFSLWKANARGVDLNVNFSAMWGLGKHNTFSPASQNFVGEHPLSEPESLALAKFLAQHKIDGSLSIHTKGEVVYWGFDHLTPAELARDGKIAELLANHLNFSQEKTVKSVGGVSDYVSEVYRCPSFTIELGYNSLTHPISSDYLQVISKSFIGISAYFAKLLTENV